MDPKIAFHKKLIEKLMGREYIHIVRLTKYEVPRAKFTFNSPFSHHIVSGGLCPEGHERGQAKGNISRRVWRGILRKPHQGIFASVKLQIRICMRQNFSFKKARKHF
jgi:hypothetical protein